MTTTAFAKVSPAATEEERRAALIELAEQIDNETAWQTKPLTPVLALIVPPLCSHVVAHDPDLALNLFFELVAAQSDFRKFCGNETDWLLERELPASDRQREATFAHLQSDLDTWADRLMGRAV